METTTVGATEEQRAEARAVTAVLARATSAARLLMICPAGSPAADQAWTRMETLTEAYTAALGAAHGGPVSLAAARRLVWETAAGQMGGRAVA